MTRFIFNILGHWPFSTCISDRSRWRQMQWPYKDNTVIKQWLMQWHMQRQMQLKYSDKCSDRPIYLQWHYYNNGRHMDAFIEEMWPCTWAWIIPTDQWIGHRMCPLNYRPMYSQPCIHHEWICPRIGKEVNKPFKTYCFLYETSFVHSFLCTLFPFNGFHLLYLSLVYNFLYNFAVSLMHKALRSLALPSHLKCDHPFNKTLYKC